MNRAGIISVISLCCFLSLCVQAQTKKPTLIPEKYVSIKKGDTLAIRNLQYKCASMTLLEKKDMLIYAAYDCFQDSKRDKTTFDFWLQQTQGMNVEAEDFKSNSYLDAVTSERMKREVLRYIDKRRNELIAERDERQLRETQLQAELREQDSLRNLMETGNYDKKKWVFNTTTRIFIREDGSAHTRGWINVSPRIYHIHNNIGEGSTAALVLLSLLIGVIFAWLMLKNVFPSFTRPSDIIFIGGSIALIQSFILYFMLSSLYTDIDQLIVRNTGKEYVAQYGYNGFCFVAADSINVAVDVGKCCFDRIVSADDIPIRYDDAAAKLAVDMQKYKLRNWNWILFIGLLLLLNLLICCGKFNGVTKKIFHSRRSEYHSPFQEYVSFIWDFKNKKYETFDQFKKELKHFQAEWGEGDKDDKMYDTPRILLQYDSGEKEKSTNFEIEIRPDNGKSISIDEWTYKLQNELTPYMKRLGEPDIVNAWIYKGWAAGEEMKCELSFYSSLNNDEVLLADIVWKFTETEYKDYRAFVKAVKEFQTQYGRRSWNPNAVAVKQPCFVLSYFNPRTGYVETYDVEADNGATLTEGELLYKLHNLMRDVMPGQEFCYLQYLFIRPAGAGSMEKWEKNKIYRDTYALFTTNDIAAR